MCIVWSYDDVYGYKMYRLIYHMNLFWFGNCFLFESQLTLTWTCILIIVPYLGWLCCSCMILQICLSTSQELKGQKVNDLPVRKSWAIPQCTFSACVCTTSNSIWLILKVGPKNPLVSYSYVGDASEGHLFFRQEHHAEAGIIGGVRWAPTATEQPHSEPQKNDSNRGIFIDGSGSTWIFAVKLYLVFPTTLEGTMCLLVFFWGGGKGISCTYWVVIVMW